MEYRKVKYKDKTITYVLTIKPVKNLNLRIRKNSVKVSANRYVPKREIDSFVLKNAPFIISALEKFSKEEKSTFENGENIGLWGKKYKLCIIPSLKEGVEVGEENIKIYSRLEDKEYAENIFLSFAKKEILKYALETAPKIYPLFSGYTPYPTFKVKKLSSRWGSCSLKTKTISLNAKLIAYPIGCLQYVLVHEFAHFKHADHSKAFYATVEKIYPKWKYFSDILKRKGEDL